MKAKLLWVWGNISKLGTIGSFFVVIAGFTAYCISARQVELARFNGIKPLFEIVNGADVDIVKGDKIEKEVGFSVINRSNSVAYFIDCRRDKNVNDSSSDQDTHLVQAPKKYSAINGYNEIGRHKKIFIFNKLVPELSCYWRDVDLNLYYVIIERIGNNYFIKGIPSVAQATKEERQAVLSFLSWISDVSLSKTWFSDRSQIHAPKDDCELIPRKLEKIDFLKLPNNEDRFEIAKIEHTIPDLIEANSKLKSGNWPCGNAKQK